MPEMPDFESIMQMAQNAQTQQLMITMLGTMGGARCVGRSEDLGSLEVGKLGDVVMWRLDGLGHEGIDDKVAALVLGPA